MHVKFNNKTKVIRLSIKTIAMGTIHVFSLLWVGSFHCRIVQLQSTGDHTCTYDFQVWQPNADMVQHIHNLELKLANFSNYIDKELFKLKYDSTTELHRYFNWTTRLERSIMQLKMEQIQKLSDIVAIKDESKLLYDKISKLNTKVDEFILHFTERADEKPRVRRKHVRKDRMLANYTPQSDRPETYLVGVLKNMVSDMKSEWILMKRDIFDLRGKNEEINVGNRQITNRTYELLASVDQLKDKWMTLKNTGLKNSNEIDSFKSNVESLKQDFYYIKDLQEQLRDEVLASKNDITTLQAKLINLKNDLEEQQAHTEQLSKGVAGQRKGETVMFKPQLAATTVVDMDPFNIPTDCSDVFFLGHRTSGVYQIKPSENHPLDNIYCEFANNTGYTVMQRRADGIQSFDRGWLEYKVGFGNLYGDFWLGNDVIHALTNRNKYGLRIDLWDWEGNKAFAEYSEFFIENEANGYKLHVNGYSGNAGDSLSFHDKMKFSTEDKDNDRHMRNCAAENKAGWWFDSCYLSNLNGAYHTGWYSHTQSTYADGIVWFTLKESERYSARKVEMKLKRQA